MPLNVSFECLYLALRCKGHAACQYQQRCSSHLQMPQVETRIDCPLSKLQTFWYRRVLLRDSQLLLSLEAEAAQDKLQVSYAAAKG